MGKKGIKVKVNILVKSLFLKKMFNRFSLHLHIHNVSIHYFSLDKNK